jgi:hypothetical protein
MTEHVTHTVELKIEREAPLPADRRVVQVQAADGDAAMEMAVNAAIARGAQPEAITVTAVDGKHLGPPESPD